jgi:hypothetical protein
VLGVGQRVIRFPQVAASRLSPHFECARPEQGCGSDRCDPSAGLGERDRIPRISCIQRDLGLGAAYPASEARVPTFLRQRQRCRTMRCGLFAHCERCLGHQAGQPACHRVEVTALAQRQSAV